MIIVCGVDASDHALAALRGAIELSDTTGAELHVVHAVFIPANLAQVMEYAFTDLSEIEKDEREALWEMVDPVLDGHAAVRVDRRGYPPEVLVEYVDDVGADLLVVGSRGRGEFASFMLGSTSQRVVTLAPCDVLVVKTREGAT